MRIQYVIDLKMFVIRGAKYLSKQTQFFILSFSDFGIIKHLLDRAISNIRFVVQIEADAGFLLEKIRGGWAKDKRPLFFETIRYCFYCSFYFFLKILEGAKVVLGGRPLPPCSRKPGCWTQLRYVQHQPRSARQIECQARCCPTSV